jgi:hypothetical protein
MVLDHHLLAITTTDHYLVCGGTLCLHLSSFPKEINLTTMGLEMSMLRGQHRRPPLLSFQKEGKVLIIARTYQMEQQPQYEVPVSI